MDGAELYLLGQKLMAVAADTLPADSVLRRIPPAARLVLEDAARHPGTSAAETAERTGLPPDQVSSLAGAMAAEGFAETAEGPAGTRIRAGRALLFREDTAPPVDAALAAALGTTDTAEVREVAGILEALARRLGTDAPSRAAAAFDEAYRGTPQWETGRPQPALAELAETGAVRGRVLDAGCGTGEHALLAAGLGLPAAGIDVSPAAIEIARRKAAERGLAARFTVHDALDLAALGEQFDTVIDVGLFHVFSDGGLAALCRRAAPGARCRRPVLHALLERPPAGRRWAAAGTPGRDRGRLRRRMADRRDRARHLGGDGRLGWRAGLAGRADPPVTRNAAAPPRQLLVERVAGDGEQQADRAGAGGQRRLAFLSGRTRVGRCPGPARFGLDPPLNYPRGCASPSRRPDCGLLPVESQPGGYAGPRLPQHLGLEYLIVAAGEVYLRDLPGHIWFPERCEGNAVAVLPSHGGDEKEHVTIEPAELVGLRDGPALVEDIREGQQLFF